MNHQTANDILGERGFKLREGYQEEGVDWMLSREWHWEPSGEIPPVKKHYGGILADEMGLGKTVMAASLLSVDLTNECKSLPLAPITTLKKYNISWSG